MSWKSNFLHFICPFERMAISFKHDRCRDPDETQLADSATMTAGHLKGRCLFRVIFPDQKLIAGERPGEACWPTSPVDADLIARKSTHLESSRAKSLVRLCILLQSNQAFATQRKHIASQSIALRVVDMDKRKSSSAQKFNSLNRQPCEVHENRLSV